MRGPRRVRLATLAAAATGALVGWLILQQYPRDPGFKVLFATPGLILVTAFVTFPFVARELLPVLEETGWRSRTPAPSITAKRR